MIAAGDEISRSYRNFLRLGQRLRNGYSLPSSRSGNRQNAFRSMPQKSDVRISHRSAWHDRLVRTKERFAAGFAIRSALICRAELARPRIHNSVRPRLRVNVTVAIRVSSRTRSIENGRRRRFILRRASQPFSVIPAGSAVTVRAFDRIASTNRRSVSHSGQQILIARRH